jgi:hypothetical protein
MAENSVAQNGAVGGLKLKMSLEGTNVGGIRVSCAGAVGLESSICISSTTMVLKVGDGLDGRGEEASPFIVLPGELAICRILVH